jgi:tetratricopeptide (TPR) repeat protein
MSYITLKCKNCGGSMSMDMNSKTITCSHCGSTFLLTELFDEKDVDFVSKFKQEDIVKKIEFNENLKQGEVCIYQGEYLKAEQHFKRAIELDDENYKGYFGVVRAKTHNFNSLPDAEDYKEYAQIALKLVDKDDQSHVQSELAKLDVLKYEKKQIEEAKRINLEIQAKQEKNKRDTENFFSKIASFLVVIITAAILFGIFLTNDFSNDSNSNSVSTYEISSVEDFEKLYTDENLLSSTIILKENLNFNGKVLSPIGSELKAFSGSFYGNGKTLSNFTIKNPNSEDTNNIGLFGVVKNAKIFGITLDGARFVDTKNNNFYSHNNLGLICGKATNSQITKCVVLDTCEIDFTENQKSSYSIGSIVGLAEAGSVISRSYSNANITATFSKVSYLGSDSLEFSVGGIVGELLKSKISQCYSSSNINTKISCESSDSIYTYSGGIVGRVKYSIASEFQLTSCYFIGTIENDLEANRKYQYISGIVGYGAYSDEMSSNYVLFESESFIQNNAPLLLSNLCDYTFADSSIYFVESEDKLLEKIPTIFSSSNWNNTDTLFPTLK